MMRNCAHESKKGVKNEAQVAWSLQRHKVWKKRLYQLFNPTNSTILKKLVNQCRLTLYCNVQSSEEVQKVSKGKDEEEEEDRKEVFFLRYMKSFALR